MADIILTPSPDKGATLTHRHPWVFSGALQMGASKPPHGSVVKIADSSGAIVGTGTFSNRGSIAVRVFEFGDASLDANWFVQKLRRADAARNILGYGPGTDTTGYRVLFGESDGIPGLVVDRYEDVFVIQIGTMGMELLRDRLIEALIVSFSPSAIVERSDSGSRLEEGLEELSTVHRGEAPGVVTFREHGVKFLADVMHGQKTGFYLDQKDLRREISRLSANRRVLNLFSNTGSFAVAALNGRATSVTNVDSSEKALMRCQPQVELNALDPASVINECADVFQWLGSRLTPEYDMVILDPPALIKSKRDADAGRKAYHFLNRAAMRLVKDGGILVSSSCSNHFSADDLAFTLRRTSVQNHVELQPLLSVTQSADHPVSLYFPEAAYLCSYICRVHR